METVRELCNQLTDKRNYDALLEDRWYFLLMVFVVLMLYLSEWLVSAGRTHGQVFRQC